ncbi:helix-turn-helix transcriptional regulator [Natronosalvus rutilus]|uniref:MarR family transcriptional regulator n=1 Tax=Natronosalvus rutilus TaxID=2953753 RepID=A0A9E7N840_9EURY|nr:helix-turn-helix domain-containing protein [Natronosalvus rutilus]UTF53474.1 MarR family transcriptional regulator [Natronosalvus rutilus]
MDARSVEANTEDVLVELIRRHDVFDVLADEPLEKPELAAALEVSPATAHRILTSFREKNWIERTAQGYALTPFGKALGRATATYRSTVAETHRLAPLYDVVTAAASSEPIDFAWFDDATVTTVEPHDPYRPLNRFIELLEATSSIRGIDTTSVSPTYVEDVYDRIADGLPVELVYDQAVVERLATEYTDLATDAFDRDNFTLWVREEVPFGLALFDDRVGIGGYDDETGLLEVFVDTDNEDAYAWGEQLFELYREDADRLV